MKNVTRVEHSLRMTIGDSAWLTRRTSQWISLCSTACAFCSSRDALQLRNHVSICSFTHHI